MLNLKSVKTQLILYLIGFIVFLTLKDKASVFLFTCLIAVISAFVIESIILYLKTKKFQLTESSIITGLIIGYVISSDEVWWKFMLAVAFAIISKHLIVFKKKHLFNPAAFGIFLSLMILGVSTQWRGTYLWYILVPFGIYFMHKINKTEVVIGYFLVALLLFGIQAVIQKVNFWNVFGYFSYFYIFVMVIEPKTTPLQAKGKYLFGAGLAGLIFILTEVGVRFDAELFSLLVLNITVPILNLLPFKKGGRV